MNVRELIDQELAAIRVGIKRVRWLRRHKDLLETLPVGSFLVEMLDFDNLDHKDILRVIKAFGGKWDKKANTVAKPGETRIDYQARDKFDGVSIRCWAGQPPPSCRLVEVEEVVPARWVPETKVKRFKLVCRGEAEPVVVAVAEAQAQTTTT